MFEWNTPKVSHFVCNSFLKHLIWYIKVEHKSLQIIHNNLVFTKQKQKLFKTMKAFIAIALLAFVAFAIGENTF